MQSPLRPLEEALAELLAAVAPLAGSETVATVEADGRVLAADVVSPLDVPGHDNSAMDGYALRAADVPQGAGVVLPVSQRIAAGDAPRPLAAGTVVRIFTGAPIPPGADAVVMQEDAEVVADVVAPPVGEPVAGGGAAVRLRARPLPGQWVRRQGEDLCRGTVVLAAGTRLGPAELGLAASMGFAALPVAPRPRVALFSTGNELVMPGSLPPQDLPPGSIYNSNRYVLAALLRRMGCVVSDLGLVPDKREATVAALREAAAGHDVVLTSGGVSVGEEDHIKPAVQALGRLVLWQIAMKPGKPFAYGQLPQPGGGTCHFVGLPGNPVSSFVTCLLLVRPLLLHLQGAGGTAWRAVPMQAHFDWPRADRRREFLRVRRNAAGGLDLFGNQSSGVLTSMAWADGLVDNPAGQTIQHGQLVPYLPLAEWL